MMHALSAVSVSRDPDLARATGEIIGYLTETLRGIPDILIVVATEHHAEQFHAALSAMRKMINPRVLIGVITDDIISDTAEPGNPGLAATGFVIGADVEAVRIETVVTPDSLVVTGGHQLSRGGTVMLLSDAASFHADAFLSYLNGVSGAAEVVGTALQQVAFGTMAHLYLDDERFTQGAIGIWFPPGLQVAPAQLNEFAPIGEPLIVTESAKNGIFQLGGRNALERFNAMLSGLTERQRSLITNGVYLGLANEGGNMSAPAHVTSVLGADRSVGAIAVQDEIAVGTTVQFHHSDPSVLLQSLGATRGTPILFVNAHRWIRSPATRSMVIDLFADLPITLSGIMGSPTFAPIGSRNTAHSVASAVLHVG